MEGVFAVTTAQANRETKTVSQTSAVHAKAIELGKHALRMTDASGSGHQSTALSIAHIVVELMYREMRYDPGNPWNGASDRLVLSIGHAVPIVYAAYADLGGAVGKTEAEKTLLKVEDLQTLRELGSVLDGHPNPAEGVPFFDAATGSLGQGLSVAAGLALAARLDKIDKRIFCVIGDGESREGQIWEAADFIVDHKLSNVTAIFSCNGHGQADSVSQQQSADAIEKKMAAFNWDVISVDGHDPVALSEALDRANASDKPTAIVAKTVKGWGVDSIIGKNFHGKPLSGEGLATALKDLDATGEKLGAIPAQFNTPNATHEVKAEAHKTVELPPFEAALKRAGLDKELDQKKLATRVAYGAALIAAGDVDPRIVAVDGDVSNSTFANMFQKEHGDRFFECKIAEQNMITVAAGLAAGGKIPFASSFAKFLARAVDQIDMAAISRANIKIVGSHSGVSLAADGPSQMSLSDVAYFRSMSRADNGRGEPVCRTFHPSDAVSAYRCVELMATVPGMCFMRTHRPAAPFLYPFDERFELDGCKQLREGTNLTIASSGYMVHMALRVADKLAESGIACNVFDAYTFPMDASPILDAARKSGGAILTVEDNFIGGLHAELAEAAAMAGDVRVVGMTVNKLPKSAKTPDEVFGYVGVGLDDILAKAREIAGKK